MALIDGIGNGVSLALLGDGTILHLERTAVSAWTLVHSAPDGTGLADYNHRRSVTDVSAHPTNPASGVTSLLARGVASVGVGAGTLTLTQLADAPGIAALAPNGATIAAITRGSGARQLEIDPATGVVTDVGPAPVGTIDLVAHSTEPALIALSSWGAQRRLHILRPGFAPAPQPLIPGARRIAAVAAGDSRLVVGFADGRTEIHDLATAASHVIDTGAGPVWGLAVRGDEVLVGTGSEVRAVPLVEAPGVDLTIDAEHYLSSWARVGVTPKGGVDIDELAFVVDPPWGGLVSASRDVFFDPAAPEVFMAVGGTVGDYKLLAVDTTTAQVLGHAEFAITDVWRDADGPTAAFVGGSAGEAPDASWGGGDPYVPQNVDVRPRTGDWRVAVVVVETNDQPTLAGPDAAALGNSLRDEIFDGVLRDGVIESTRLYFDAVSDGELNLVDAGLIVAIRLPNAWDDYTDPDTATGQTKGDGLPNFATAAVAEIVRINRDAVAAGALPILDLDSVDSLVIVMRSIPMGPAGTFPGRYQWAYGTRPGGYQLIFNVGEDVVSSPWGDIAVPRTRTIQALTIASNYTSIPGNGGRTVAECVAHELGHNFGLHDAYWDADKHKAEYEARELDSWGLMGYEIAAPEPAVVERMMLGWVPANRVRTISVGVEGYVDEEVTLHPSSSGAPVPAGRRQAVELRIADGRNYYFEYRRSDAARLSDQDLHEDKVVFGTDYISGDTPPVDRRPLLLLRDDPDADGATFALGDDYRESDTTDPSYPNDFTMTVLETHDDFARIRLRYADAKADPSIRPWAQSTNWKSPDLRVENARNLQNPDLRDIPWEGHDNWIVATVRNSGRDDATDVEVSFAVKDFTLGGGAESSLGSVTIPVLNAGDEVEVTSPGVWQPPPLGTLIPWLLDRQHYCVKARITAQPDEITDDNNEAQSNHTRLISASGSPSTRETGVVKVTNPHPVPARCRVVVRQTDPLSRTYLQHAWVQLDPGEERDVRFFTESMIGDPTVAVFTRERESLSWEKPNSLRLTGVADTGQGCHGDVVGGAHVLVVAGRRTRFVDLYVGRGYARGRVEVEEDGSGVWGDVTVSLRAEKDGKDLGVFTGPAINGNFAFEFDRSVADARVAQAESNGGYSAAPCLSEWVDVPD